MEKLIEKMVGENRFPSTVWVYRRLLYGLLIWYFGSRALFFSDFFGQNSFILPYDLVGNQTNLFFQYLGQKFPVQVGIGALIGLFTSLLFGLLGKLPRISAFMIWVFAEVLVLRYWDITNGGENLLLLLLFYNIFLGEKKLKTASFWLISASNFGIVASRIQVAILYGTAGVAKLFGTYWVSGEAFTMVSQVDGYSSNGLRMLVEFAPSLANLITYGVLLYQLSFPIFIWFKKIRPFVLLVGMAFHIGIGFLNGIMDFALIMIVSYVLFYDETKMKNFQAFIFSLIRKAGIKSIKASGD